MSKNILFISSSYPFGIGESFISTEIEFLSKYFKVYVTPTYPRGDIKLDRSANENIIYLNLPLLKIDYAVDFLKLSLANPNIIINLLRNCKSDSFIRFCRNAILIPKSINIHKFVVENNIEFIYSHWLSAPTQLALLLNILSGVPYGATGHRWDVVDANNFERKFEKVKFIRLISRKSISLLPQAVQEKYKEKFYIIHMGINIQNNYILSNKKVKDNEGFSILCIANLTAVKGHKYLIEAIKNLKEKGINISLDLIGEGELKQDIIKQISDLGLNSNINLLGTYPHTDVLKILQSGKYSLYCQPSVDLGKGSHEGIPVSLMEAMSNSIPCISTNTGSIPELILDGETGLLVEDKNSKVLADAIEKLYKDNELRSNIAKAAYDSIFQNFNESINNKKIYELIASRIFNTD